MGFGWENDMFIKWGGAAGDGTVEGMWETTVVGGGGGSGAATVVGGGGGSLGKWGWKLGG